MDMLVRMCQRIGEELSGRVLSRAALEPEEVIGGGRSARRFEHGAAVHAVDLEPTRDIGRVVHARDVRDAKICARERGAEFGDEFLDGVSLFAELRAELPVETGTVTSPVRELVKQRRVVALGGATRRRSDEPLSFRYLNEVAEDVEVRMIPAMPDIGP